MSRKPVLTGGFALLVASLVLLVPGRPWAQDVQDVSQYDIKKPKIFDDTFQLINETDLNCSLYLHEAGKLLPDIQIVGAERMNERSIYDNEALIYINRGSADGLEIGQLFLVVGVRETVPKLGTVMKREGRARIVRLEDRTASAKIEKGCGAIQIGDYLLPFEEEPGEIGKDQGFGDMDPNASKRGRVVYMDWGFHIAGPGHWALIDLGRQHCVQIGDQLNVFHRPRPDMPREAVASAIIIDVRGATSTVKILSARDSVNLGDEVQIVVAR